MEIAMIQDDSTLQTQLPPGYILRPPTLADVPATVAMLNANSLALVGTPSFNEDELATDWQEPGFSLATDSRVVTAPDGQELINWLRAQPLFVEIPHQNAVLSHAGIPPCWTIKQARTLAAEVSQVLQNEQQLHQFLGGMYGNSPSLWHEHLRGTKRWRVITNYLTRMRLCNFAGELEFSHKEGLNDLPDGYYPWFNLPNPSLKNTRILFGHWAALEGNGPQAPIIALDGGCVWGGQLLAYRLDDGQFFSAKQACVDCGLE